MNPNKIPYSANRKVVWWNGYNTAIEEVEKMIKNNFYQKKGIVVLSVPRLVKFEQELQSMKEVKD